MPLTEFLRRITQPFTPNSKRPRHAHQRGYHTRRTRFSRHSALEVLEDRTLLAAVAADDSYSIDEGSALRIGGFAASDNLITEYDATAISGIAEGDPVPSWTDLSGNGNDATATQAGTFAAGGIGGRAAVDFDLHDNYLSAHQMGSTYGIQGDASWTMVWVAKVPVTAPGTRSIGAIGSGGGVRTSAIVELDNARLDVAGGFGHDVVLSPTNSFSQFVGEDVVLTFRHEGGTGQPMLDTTDIFVNGYAPGEGTLASNFLQGFGSAVTSPYQIANTQLTLGGGSVSVTPGFDGLLAEMHLYDSALSDEDLAHVEYALGQKYGIAGGFEAPPTVGLLDNDSGTGPLSASLVSGPANGTLTLDADGSLLYTPNVGFTGVDSFTYRVNDGTSDSNVATVSINVADVQSPADLVSFWPAEGHADDTVSGNNGILQNGTGFGPGYTGQAFQFDGSDDFVSGSLSNHAGGDSEVTIAAWFNQDGAVGHPGKGIFGVGSTQTNSHFFLRTAARGSDGIWDGGDGQNRLWIGVDDNGADKWWASNAVIDPGQWYHAAATYSPATREVSLYIDGQLDRTITLSAGLNLTTDFWIGGDAYADNFFNGRVDEPRLYSRTLTAQEVALVHNTNFSPPTIGALAASPSVLLQGTDLTLTVDSVTTAPGNDAEVAFYWDADGNGLLDTATDVLLGVDDAGSDGWNLTAALTDIPAGTQSFLAQATDSVGQTSSLAATSVEVTPAVYWDGDAGDFQWSNALNWSGDTLPGSTDDVVINVPAEITVEHQSGSTNVRDLYSAESLTIGGGSLTVSGDAAVLGWLTVAGGATLRASGPDAHFQNSGGAVIDRANLIAVAGGRLELSGATTYVAGVGDGVATLLADGAASQLTVSDVTSMSGFTRHGRIEIRAENGGTTSLPNLSEITGGSVQVIASDASSEVNLPALANWADTNQYSESSVRLYSGGTINLTSLASAQAVAMQAFDGETLTLLALNSISGYFRDTFTHLASGAGSVVSMPVLTTASGSLHPGGRMQIQALDGGLIDMPQLTNVTGGATRILARDAGSTINMPALTEWIDDSNYYESAVQLFAGGTINLTSLASAQAVAMQAYDGETLTLPALNSISGYFRDTFTHLASGAGSVVAMPVLTTASGSLHPGGRMQIQALDGGLIDMPQLANITGGATRILARDAGSTINMPALTEWIDDSNYYESAVQLFAGGTINLSSLASAQAVAMQAYDGETLALPALDSISGYFRDTFTHLASGAGSVVSMPVLTTASGSLHPGGRMQIQALDGGLIDMPQLTNVTGGATRVLARDAGTINMPALTEWIDDSNYYESAVQLFSGGTINLTSLASAQAVAMQAYDGETLTLPALDSISGYFRDTFTHLASGAGSVVSMPVLTTASGSLHPGGRMQIQALDGGLIDMPQLTNVTGGATRVLARDAGTINMPALTEWIDDSNYYESAVQLFSGGTINLTSLASAQAVAMQAYDGETLTLPALTSISGYFRDTFTHLASGAGSVVSMPVLTTASGSLHSGGRMRIHAIDGGQMQLPQLREITGGVTQILVSGPSSAVSTALETWARGGDHESYLDVAEGSASVSGTTTSFDGVRVTVRDHGLIAGTTFVLNAGSQLTGIGTIRADVQNNATVQPGDSLGRLTINGDFENSSSGNVVMELGGTAAGTQHDQLVVTGTATLDGTLNISLANGFTPASGNSFQVLQFDSRVCDFLTKNGTDLGNGLHLAAAFDLTSMTLNAGSTPDSGQQCQTIPVLTNVDVGPDPAKAGDDLSITFEVDVALSSTPEVTVAGNAATFSAQNGSLYTFTYTVAGIEPEGDVDVEISATSLDGGIATETISTELDFTSPIVSNITPSHEPADVGTVLTVSFSSTEALSNSTEVLIGGQPASRVTSTSYSRLLTGDEGLGQVTVEVAAVDLAGNTSSATDQVLIVSGGLDVNATSIDLSDDRPAVGQTVTATSSIHNSGLYDAVNVPVRLTLVQPDGAEVLLLDAVVPSIAAGGSAVVSADIDLTTAGIHVLRLDVDPDNVIPEITELDNVATRSLIVDSAAASVISANGSLSTTSVVPGGRVNVAGSASYLSQLNPAGPAAGSIVDLNISSTFVTGTSFTNSNGDFSLQFDAPLVPGDYVANVTVSDVTTQSLLTLPFTVTAPPGGVDFYTTNSLVNASDFTPVINNPVTLSARIYNIGGDDFGGATNVRFYDNGTLISTQSITGLASGASAVVSFDHTFTTAGPHDITAIVDEDDLTAENNESNNSGARTVNVLDNVPDLTPTDITFSDGTPATTDTVTITARVRNLGGSDATDVVVRFFDGANPLGAAVVPAIAADGGTEFVAIQAVLPTAGQRNISVVVDPDNAVVETDETNNTRVETIVVHDPAPDLVSSIIQLSDSTPVVGDPIDVSMTVVNSGELDATAFDATFFKDGTSFGTVRVPGLAAGASTIVTLSTSFSTVGGHSVRIDLDSADELTELSETNNTASRGLQVLATPLSDLRISGSEIALSDSNPGAGDTVTVTVPVRNVGQAVATGVTAELRIDGVVVGSAATSPADIAAGQSADWTFDFTAPAGDGFHLLEIVVDQDNLIGESNENNNRDFLQILVGDHPDLVLSGIAFSNDNPVEGDVITISATVTNDGDAAVGEFLVRILDGSQQIGQVTVPSLAIGASEVVGVSFDTTGRTGTRLIQVIADPGNLITEFNEGDNLISRNLTIASADAVAPVTVATPSVAANAAGWNNTDVDVVLTASDNVGGSGVAYLRYSVNGGPLQTTLGDTQTIAFSSEGIHSVAYQAVDFAQNAEALQTLTVRIDKTAPVAVHGGTYDVAEGSTITLDGTASSDPLSGIANIQWALDGDGQFNDGATPSYAAPDGPLTVPVQLRVTDEAGNETTVATEIIVSNVAPTANAGSDVDVPEGSSIALDGSGSSDPGDDIQSFLWDLDGDGSFGEVGADAELGDEVGSAVTFDASLLDGPESRTVKLRVTDDFGAVHEDTVTVSVTNVGPAFEAGANVDLVPADEGILTRNNIAFTDPGAADVHTVVVNFGDGTGDQSVTLVSGLRSFDLGHTYDSEGQFTVSITVSDDDGEAATDSFIVDVDLNTAPETATDANPAANEVAEAAATGSLVGITAEAVDADNDTLTYSLDNSAGGRFRIDSSNGIVTVDNGSLLDGPQTHTITVRSTDPSGEFSTANFSITVTNVAPTVAANNAAISVAEGSTATNAGNFADVGDDTVAITASIGTITQDDVAGTWAWSWDTSDGPDDSQTVTITATDSDGAATTTTFDLTVTNVAPTVAATNAAISVAEGSTATNGGSFADAGDDTVAVTASVGTVIQDDVAGTWAWSWDTSDGPDDSQTVTITATDSDGAATTTTFDLTVTNVAPTVAATNAAISVAEGSTATNTGNFADVGDDTVAVTASVGTITQDDVAGTWAWSWDTSDGPDDSQTVTITATDSDGAATTTTFDLTVTNVAPTVAATNAAISVDEGSTATNAGNFADVGDDAVAITASIGTITQNDAAGTWAWSWDTSDGPDESQTVTITATDSDGAATTTTFDLTVTNVAPTVAANNAAISVDEGSTATNAGNFADVGDDTVAVTASIGTIIQDDVAGTWAWSWDTSDGPDDSQTVTITATDSDGAAITTTFDLTVTNVAPTVAATNATVTVDEGSTATNAGNFADVGDDNVAVTASVGVVTQDDVAGTWAWSWDTSDGPDDSQTVTITATDSDGAATTTTFDLTVTNVAPTVAANNAAISADEGSTANNAGSFADVGDDTVAITASVGVVTQDDVAGTWAWSWDTSDGPDESQTVTITATDSDGAATTITFDLTVTNVAPTVSDATFEVLENSANGTVVGTLTATDPGDDSLTFSITGGTGASAFTVDPVSGTVSVADHTQLDFETTPVFTLEVAVTDEDGASDTALVTINLRNQATISGVVYVDTNQNGNFDANEVGIDGVTVELLNEAGDVLFSTVTDDGGLYFFEDMDAGTYRIRESQPSGVTDGPEQLGSVGGSVVANDEMQVSVTDLDAADYNFAEYGQQLSSGDTAGIGFWQNKHGQALIAEGGTELASWLTENFGNIFGSEFVGATGADVAVFYKYQLFKQKGKKAAGPAKVDAQFMAVAFATFFTSRNLAGNVATNYGFNVSDTGIGTNIVNVGNRGAAFEVDDHTDLTILQLLLATNALTDTPDNYSGFASIYDRDGDGKIDSYEAFLRTLANDLFSSINE